MEKKRLEKDILSFLKVKGITSMPDIQKYFSLSQVSLSRLVAGLKHEIIKFGKARKTKYALLRKLPDIPSSFPIYEIDENGKTKLLGTLYVIEPKDYYFEPKLALTNAMSTHDLPYFLNDLRPSGFIGHLIPLLNKDLRLPNEIKYWNADHCLKYLSSRSWNHIGNLIIGESSYKKYLQNIINLEININENEKHIKYSYYADHLLSLGQAGSSAGGEQPKFLARLSENNRQVIIKFSPYLDNALGRRVADLLICEDIALKTIAKYKIPAAKTEIIVHANRVFLEVERFDRVNEHGRIGVISLGTLDAEFTGVLDSWTKTSIELINKKIIPKECFRKIQWLENFGNLIANSDMHSYNLSFIMKELKITELCPAYDILPMLFMPKNNQIINREFSPPLPNLEESIIWKETHQAAVQFWQCVLTEKRISEDFKGIARICLDKILKI